jgi:hypothetical protein
MRRRTWGMAIVVAGAAVAGTAWLLLSAPRPAGPEERIRALLEGAARAAEQRKVGAVVEVLSERFTGGGDGEGERATRDEVRRLLALELLRGRWVSVTISSAEISVEGHRARASVDAVLSRAEDRTRGLAALLPGEVSAHRFRLELEEEEGEWRVVSGRWRSIGLEEAIAGPGAPGG